MGTWERMATNRKVGEKKRLREWELSERGGGGKEDGTWESGFFRPLLKLPETQTQECRLFLVSALWFSLTRHAPKHNSGRVYGSLRLRPEKKKKKSLLIYHCHLKITQVAKNKPWILPVMPVFKRQPIFSGIHKNILAVRILQAQFDCQMWPLWE